MWSVLKFWSLPGSPHEPTLHRNPEKRSFASQWDCFLWHVAPFNVPSDGHLYHWTIHVHVCFYSYYKVGPSHNFILSIEEKYTPEHLRISAVCSPSPTKNGARQMSPSLRPACTPVSPIRVSTSCRRRGWHTASSAGKYTSTQLSGPAGT